MTNRRRKRMLTALAILVLVITGADFTYDRITHHRHDQWEKNIVKRHPDGTRVGYEEFSCGTGRVALLMVHGFAAGPLTWGRMAPALATNGFTCRAILLPGYGRPMDEYEKATREQWRADIRENIADLRKTHDQVWLVGHSMGGALTTLEAIDRPADINGLILLAPFFEVSSRRSPYIAPRTLHRITDTLVIFTDLTQMAFPVDVHDPEVRPHVIRDDFVPRTIYTQLFGLLDELQGRAHELKTPILLVTAPDDLVTDPEDARDYITAATNAPRTQMLSQTNAGHVTTWDYGWEETTRAITTFINTTSPAR